MRRDSLFWGVIIVLAGVMLLIGNLVPGFNFWTYFWPLVLILLGVWFLLGPVLFKENIETRPVSVALETSSDATLHLHHGAGQLRLAGGAAPGLLLSGSVSGRHELSVERQGYSAIVRLSANPSSLFMGPWNVGSRGYSWDLNLCPDIPLKLDLETGANEAIYDLSALKVIDLKLKTGASSSVVTLPAQAGYTSVKVESGAASVKLHLPQGVAGRIRVQSGLAGIDIDTNRFPKMGDLYVSPDFENQPNRAEIFIETGVASIEVR